MFLLAISAFLFTAGCSDDAGSQEAGADGEGDVEEVSVAPDTTAPDTSATDTAADILDTGEQDIAVDTSTADTQTDPDTADTAITPDTAVTPDTAITPDTTVPVDTTPPPTCGADGERCCINDACDGTLVCLAGTCGAPATCTTSCITPTTGTPDVPVNMVAGKPPTLAGGTVGDATYNLTLVEIYNEPAFTDLVTNISITSNGNTYGSLSIVGQDWGLDANFDLLLSMTAIGSTVVQPILEHAGTGGCFEVRGNLLVTDLTQCGGVWPGTTGPPNALEFESTATELVLKLVLPEQMLLESLPPEYQSLGFLAIEGDLPIVMTFTMN